MGQQDHSANAAPLPQNPGSTFLYPAFEESLYDGWWQVLRDNFLSPGFQLHWKHRKFILSREFQEFVEQKVMTRNPTPSYAESVAKKEARDEPEAAR